MYFLLIYPDVRKFNNPKPELILCAGDTLAHLANKEEIIQFITDSADILSDEGTFIISFRDYSTALIGDSRFIQVKSDDTRILTCFLEYSQESVLVTDLFYEKTDEGWQQHVSSYNKVRISQQEIIDLVEKSGLKILLNETVNRMITVIAQKSSA